MVFATISTSVLVLMDGMVHNVTSLSVMDCSVTIQRFVPLMDRARFMAVNVTPTTMEYIAM